MKNVPCVLNFLHCASLYSSGLFQLKSSLRKSLKLGYVVEDASLELNSGQKSKSAIRKQEEKRMTWRALLRSVNKSMVHAAIWCYVRSWSSQLKKGVADQRRAARLLRGLGGLFSCPELLASSASIAGLASLITRVVVCARAGVCWDWKEMKWKMKWRPSFSEGFWCICWRQGALSKYLLLS